MLNDRKFRRIFFHDYEDSISLENLLASWKEFIRGKRQRKDVQLFQASFMDNIIQLHEDLMTGKYNHGTYESFKINDPKPRDIHKASVQDRLVHRLLYRSLYPHFDKIFISDSFSCRLKKGTHRAMKRFESFGRIVSKNNTTQTWVLKCDVRKFFASIDHETLYQIIDECIDGDRLKSVLRSVISSFCSTSPGKGLPLGNLTSQLLVNIYMNEFDHYVKHTLKSKHYIRYADDFVLLSNNKNDLENNLVKIKHFLNSKLKLDLHPDKVSISTLSSGIDFLGWVHFPTHRVMRTTTKHRMIRNLKNSTRPETVESYRGLLSHGNAYKLSTEHLQI